MAKTKGKAAFNPDKFWDKAFAEVFDQKEWAVDQAQTIICGNARFQVLSPTLIRMEYSPTAAFADAPSAIIINRRLPSASFKSRKGKNYIEISTSALVLRYRLDSGPFTKENLSIKGTVGSKKISWTPGVADTQNLNGCNFSIDWVPTPPVNPGLLSRSGYSLVDDSRTPLWSREKRWIEPRPESDSIDWYFFAYGLDYAQMLREFSQIAGRIPMIPRYTLGAWFSSRVSRNDQQLLKIADRFREEDMPLDILVLDSGSCAQVIWIGYDWDPEQMPDPKAFAGKLAEKGVRVSRNEHYGALLPFESCFNEIIDIMGMPKDSESIPLEISDKRMAAAFMEKLHRSGFDAGFAFWWLDGHAPAKMEGLNAMFWTRAVEFEGMEIMTGKRPFLFGRHGGLGSHRYPSFFTGDCYSEWEMLEYEIPYTAQCGNVLDTWVTHDIGGFTFSLLDRDLYLRWVQFGCLSPLFRLHGIFAARLPWEYGDEAVRICRKFFKLRYSLVPYIYSHSRVMHEQALPLVGAMYIQYPDQEDSYRYRGQYTFGRELLVAPITMASDGALALKDVFLPKGSDWFDLESGTVYSGGQILPYECPIDRMPIFARSGSIIPTQQPNNYVDEKPADPVILNIFAGADAAFELYEDDGVSVDFRKNEFARAKIEFAATAKEGNYKITIHPTQGAYKGQLAKRKYEIRLNGLLMPDKVKIGANAEYDWSWDNAAKVTTVTFSEGQDIRKKIVAEIEGAGTFEDFKTLQKAIEIRNRIRRVKDEQKLKFLMVMNLSDYLKPPRMFLEAEKVEWELDDLIADPKGLARRKPDFKKMIKQVLKGITDRPFDLTRKHPDKNFDKRVCTPNYPKGIQNAESQEFEPLEIARMTAMLLGLNIHSDYTWDDQLENPANGLQIFLKIRARLDYDAEVVGKVKTRLQLAGPDGWAISNPRGADGGYTSFDIREPHAARSGTRAQFRIKATIEWEGGEIEYWDSLECRK